MQAKRHISPARYTRGVKSGSLRESQRATVVVAFLAVVGLFLFRAAVPLDAAAGFVLPWFFAAFLGVAALGAGYPVARLLLGRRSPPVDLAVVLAAGAALLAVPAVLLAFAGWFRPLPLLVVLLAAAVAGIVVGLRGARGMRLPNFRRAPMLWWIFLLLAVVAGMGLFAPPAMYDSLNYHLAFPEHWLSHGGMIQFPRQGFSYYPAGEGMLFAYALVSVGGWGAKAVHWWLALVAGLGAGALGERLGGGRAGGWAAVLFMAAPPVLTMSGMASTDLGVAAWAGASFLLLVDGKRWRGRPGGTGVLTGLLLGGAVAAKYLALATVLVPAAVMLSFLLVGEPGGARTRRAAWAIAGCAAGFLGIAGPWLIRNLLWVGNPLYPYLASVLGGPSLGMTIGRELAQSGPLPGSFAGWLWRTVTAPIVRTFKPMQLGGTLGLQFFILLPAAALLADTRRKLGGSLWLGLLVGTIAWASLVPMARFATPELLLAAPLAGLAMARLTAHRVGRPVRAVVLALAAFVGLWNVSMLTDRFTVDRVLVVAGTEKVDAFLRRWVSYWPAVPWINDHLPSNAGVLLVGEPRSYGIERRVIVEDPFHTPLLVEMARRAPTAQALAARLAGRAVSHVLVNPAEMRRIAAQRGLASYWGEAGARERRIIADLLERGVVREFVARDGVWVGRLKTPPPGAGISARKLTF